MTGVQTCALPIFMAKYNSYRQKRSAEIQHHATERACREQGFSWLTNTTIQQTESDAPLAKDQHR